MTDSTAQRKIVPSQPSEPSLLQPPPAGWTGGQIVAALALAALAFGGAFAHVRDPDIFWQIACGDWMFQHHRVLDHDPFGVDPAREGWVNVHWGFQLIDASLYKLGGWDLICYVKGILAAALAVAFVAALRKGARPFWIALCGCLLLNLIQGRVERPESFTFILLVLTFYLAESVRTGASPRRLWWMVPIMLFWVNIHGLFFFGPLVLWCMVVGAALDKAVERVGRGVWLLPAIAVGAFVGYGSFKLGLFRPEEAGEQAGMIGLFSGVLFALLALVRRQGGLDGKLLTRAAILPIVAASVACLVSPWPLETLRQPLVLSTRLGNAIYAQIVAELLPTVWILWDQPFVVAALVLGFAAMAVGFRKLPLSHIALALLFTFLGLLAVRNMALMAILLAILLAIHAAPLVDKLLAKVPQIRFAAVPLVVAAILATVAFDAETLARNSDPLGPGVNRRDFPLGAADFLARLDAGGDLYCNDFGDGGVFEKAFNYGRQEPVRLVYIDGRLERTRWRSSSTTARSTRPWAIGTLRGRQRKLFHSRPPSASSTFTAYRFSSSRA